MQLAKFITAVLAIAGIGLISSCEKEVLPGSVSEAAILPEMDSIPYPFPPHDLLDIHNDTISFLALGDSYTIGQNVAMEERWPVQLADRLSNMPELVVLDPVIIAQTGWTTAALSSAMTNAGVDDQSFDLVSLLIGVNNQYTGQEPETFAPQFEDLLQRAINIAGDSTRVFVLSIPDYGYTPFGVPYQDFISTDIEAFNAVCQTISENYGVAFYNITPISQGWPEVPGLIASDGLHPSGYQYTLWVDQIWMDVLGQITE